MRELLVPRKHTLSEALFISYANLQSTWLSAHSKVPYATVSPSFCPQRPGFHFFPFCFCCCTLVLYFQLIKNVSTFYIFFIRHIFLGHWVSILFLEHESRCFKSSLYKMIYKYRKHFSAGGRRMFSKYILCVCLYFGCVSSAWQLKEDTCLRCC